MTDMESPALIKTRAPRDKQKNKERAKENRRLQKEEFEYLQNRVAELTSQLRGHTKMLPWREIASALQAESSTAQTTNRTLRRDIQRTKDILQCLLVMVCGTASRMPETSPIVQISGWKDQALLGIDGDARVASYRWLINRLFHNTDLAYAQCPNTPSVLIDVKCDDHVVTTFIRTHYVAPVPMDQAVRTIQGLYKWDFFVDIDRPICFYDKELLEESFGPNTFHVDYEYKTTIVESCRESSCRTVFARCCVNFDAAHQHVDRYERCDHEWRILEPLSDSTCRILHFRSVSLPVAISNDEFATITGARLDNVKQWTESERLENLMKQRYEMYSMREERASN